MNWIDVLFGRNFYVSLAAGLIAVIGLILSKYKPKVMIICFFCTFLSLYGPLTIRRGVIKHNEYEFEQYMYSELDEFYQEQQEKDGELGKLGHLALQIGAQDDDNEFDNSIYIANYNTDYTFDGQLQVWAYNDKREKVFKKKFYISGLQPGEKRYVDYFETEKLVESYEWKWMPINKK